MRNRQRRRALGLAGLAGGAALLGWLWHAAEESPARRSDAPAVSASPPAPPGPTGAMAPWSTDTDLRRPAPGALAGRDSEGAEPHARAGGAASRADAPAPGGTPHGTARRTPPNLLAGGPAGALHLETPELWPGALSARLEGLDTAAPRALSVWLEDEDGSFRLLGSGHSNADGSLSLPALVPGADPRDVRIAPAGADPAGAAASQPRTLDAAGVHPPRLLAGPDPADAEGRTSLRVIAGESRGEVLLQADDGREIARLSVPTLPDPRRGIFDLALDLRPGTTVLAAHRTPDGRFSQTVAFTLERPAPTASGAGLGATLEALSR